MSSTVTRPPYDPELEAALGALSAALPGEFTADAIPQIREVINNAPLAAPIPDGIEVADVTIAGFNGDDIVVSIYRRAGRTGTGPGIFHIHGGGMIIGNRHIGTAMFFTEILEHNAVVVTVEYRLAPEFPDPYPVEDAYAGLVWTADHVAELGIEADRLLLAGASAGGGLSAGVALLARDRQGPALVGQLLMCPMLDDRDNTVATRQYSGTGTWSRESNITGWTALLGDRRGSADVSIYAAPARATDLSHLPPAYIDCGSAEVFRDEDVAYATGIWAAGGQAELHVWEGGFHGFDGMAPHTAVAQASIAARTSWVRRILGL